MNAVSASLFPFRFFLSVYSYPNASGLGLCSEAPFRLRTWVLNRCLFKAVTCCACLLRVDIQEMLLVFEFHRC